MKRMMASLFALCALFGTMTALAAESDNPEIGANADLSLMASNDGYSSEVPMEDGVVAVRKVVLDVSELALNSGSTYRLTATVTPDNATNKKVSWTSSDSAVAAVDSNGTVTAVGSGTAVITATAGSKTAKCTVIVRMPGDVNGDGKVNMQDSTILRRYLANWTGVTVNASNADVSGDGIVDMQDSTILRRWLANWTGVVLQ